MCRNEIHKNSYPPSKEINLVIILHIFLKKEENKTKAQLKIQQNRSIEVIIIHIQNSMKDFFLKIKESSMNAFAACHTYSFQHIAP